MFKDGQYRFVESTISVDQRETRMAVYRAYAKPGETVRYIQGEDHKYHIYIRIITAGETQ